MILSDKMYDIVRTLITLILPAIGTLLFGINEIWDLGLPAEEIVATITVVCTFLGTIFNISRANYYKDVADEG